VSKILFSVKFTVVLPVMLCSLFTVYFITDLNVVMCGVYEYNVRPLVCVYSKCVVCMLCQTQCQV
jgi:NAD-dependent dihydropyrimidine dehydrogenase PreA subunit